MSASVDLAPSTPLLGADNKKKTKRRKRCLTLLAALVGLAVIAVLVCWALGVFDSSSDADEEEVWTENMELHYLTDKSIKCNDGSRPGYYLRRSPNNTNWVVLFAGGNCCWDNDSCKDRAASSQHAEEMTGPVEEEIEGGGISSSNSSENPFMHDWNNVYVHYCSSDDWLGTMSHTTSEGWFMDISFHGGKIVSAVYDDLIAYHGMGTAGRIVHAGYSVGGLGVLQWFDRVYDRLTTDVPAAKIYGFSDSGWWLYNESYHDYAKAPYLATFPLMWDNFGPSLEPECVAAGLDYKCFHGELVYPYIQHADRLFISQQIFDKIHANSEGFLLGSTYTGDPWPYAEADHYVSTFAQVPNLFATDCRNHDIINSEDWTVLKISNTSLADAFNMWLHGETVRLIDDVCMTEDCNPSCTVIDPLECFFFGLHCE